MIAHILLAPPVVEPVELAAFKNYARIEHNEDDSLLESLLCAARQWCEPYTRRAFIHQTWDLSLTAFPEGRSIFLPRGPLVSIASVYLYDEDDQENLWGDEHYYANKKRVPGRLCLRRGHEWPQKPLCDGGMSISYVAGYGASADDVPAPIKLAIMQLALHWYEYRGEPVHDGLLAKAPMTVEALLEPYRLYGLGGGGL